MSPCLKVTLKQVIEASHCFKVAMGLILDSPCTCNVHCAAVAAALTLWASLEPCSAATRLPSCLLVLSIHFLMLPCCRSKVYMQHFRFEIHDISSYPFQSKYSFVPVYVTKKTYQTAKHMSTHVRYVRYVIYVKRAQGLMSQMV